MGGAAIYWRHKVLCIKEHPQVLLRCNQTCNLRLSHEKARPRLRHEHCIHHAPVRLLHPIWRLHNQRIRCLVHTCLPATQLARLVVGNGKTHLLERMPCRSIRNLQNSGPSYIPQLRTHHIVDDENYNSRLRIVHPHRAQIPFLHPSIDIFCRTFHRSTKQPRGDNETVIKPLHRGK